MRGRRGRVEVGQIHESARCGNFEVIDYNNSKNILIKFLETDYITTTTSSHILRGSVNDPMRPCELGFYLGNRYTTTDGGKRTRAYMLWTGMKERCYGGINPTSVSYHRQGTTVCDEWKSYTTFHDWVIHQHGYNLDNYDLDKDLKRGNMYSPQHCTFLPKPINIAMQYGDNRNQTSGLLAGVKRSKNKFTTRIMVDNKEKHLGSYVTQEEAHVVYKNAKARWVSTLAERYRGELPVSTYDLLMRWHPDGYSSTRYEIYAEHLVKT